MARQAAPAASASVKSTGSAPKKSRWAVNFLCWGVALPIITILVSVATPLLYRYSRLQVGEPYSILTNSTVINYPSNYHSRWRGPDYIHKYDRFFFQWWNFLVYDAETHDHWTVVYHTTKFSQAAKYDAYASASMVHKRGPIDVLSAHDAIPLADLDHTRDWDLGLRKPDGSTPHRVTIIDDDTYNVIADIAPEYSAKNVSVKWNLTFHRVHGMYSGLDNEKGNEDNCAIVSTLFGYHSKVSGWIEEGDQRWTFGTDGAAGSRYRAYAAGSWGCKLPAGYPEIRYPWTWLWLVIPADATATPPRPEIGMAMGTARFQLNVSALGDLYGGFASVGVGRDITTVNFADLHHNSTWQVPLTKSATDDFLKLYENGLSNWTTIVDAAGEYEVPLVQTYDVETAHHRFKLIFHSKPEEYFRLPVVVESLEPASVRAQPRRLAVFSDFRACGVRTEVQVWKRRLSPQQQREANKGKPTPPTPLNPDGSVDEFALGGWDEVVYDGEVTSLNALEFAYQAPVADQVYQQFLAPQKFASAN